MIRVTCDGCQKQYSVPEQFAGKKVKCKSCSGVISIPAAEQPPAEQPPAEEREPSVEPEEEPAAPKLGEKGFHRKKTFPTGFKKGALKGGAPKKSLGAKGAAGPRKPLGAGKFQSKGTKLSSGGMKRTAGLKRTRPQPSDEGGEPSGDDKKKLLYIVGGVVGLLVVGALVYFLVIAPGSSEPSVSTPDSTPSARSSAGGGESTETASTQEPEPSGLELEGVGKTTEPEVITPPAPSAGPVGALDVIPKDAGILAHISVGQLTNAPGVGEWIEEARAENEELVEFLNDAEFDPFANLSSIWFAGSLPAEGLGAEATMPYVAVVEGAFNQEKLIAALQARDMLSTGPSKLNDRDVYQMLEEDEIQGYMTFLSASQILLGEESYFNQAMSLLEGGDSVKANSALADLTLQFSRPETVWAAFTLNQETKDAIAAQSKQMEEQMMPPLPALEGGLLGLDPTPLGDGMILKLDALCASPDDATKAQQWVSTLALMARQASLPPPVMGLLDKLKVMPAGNKLQVSLEVPESVIEELKKMPLVGPPGLEPGMETETDPEAGTEGAEGAEAETMSPSELEDLLKSMEVDTETEGGEDEAEEARKARLQDLIDSVEGDPEGEEGAGSTEGEEDPLESILDDLEAETSESMEPEGGGTEGGLEIEELNLEDLELELEESSS